MPFVFIALGSLIMFVPIGYLWYLTSQNRRYISRIEAVWGIVLLLGGFIFAMLGVGQLINQGNDSYQHKCAVRGGTIQHGYCYKPGSEIHIP
jgi:hypothetical protein